MKSIKHLYVTRHFLSSFSIDCGLYIETIQHEIVVLRTKESIGFMTIFHINSLNTENKTAFSSLSRFDSWQNSESQRRLTITVEYVGKKTSEKTWFKCQIPEDTRVLSDLAEAVRTSVYRLKNLIFVFPQIYKYASYLAKAQKVQRLKKMLVTSVPSTSL